MTTFSKMPNMLIRKKQRIQLHRGIKNTESEEGNVAVQALVV